MIAFDLLPPVRRALKIVSAVAVLVPLLAGRLSPEATAGVLVDTDHALSGEPFSAEEGSPSQGSAVMALVQFMVSGQAAEAALYQRCCGDDREEIPQDASGIAVPGWTFSAMEPPACGTSETPLISWYLGEVIPTLPEAPENELLRPPQR